MGHRTGAKAREHRKRKRERAAEFNCPKCLDLGFRIMWQRKDSGRTVPCPCRKLEEDGKMGSSDTARVIRESLDHQARCAECRESGECAALAAVWDEWRALPPWSRQGSLF